MNKEKFIQMIIDRLAVENKKSEIIAFKNGVETNYFEVYADGKVIQLEL